MITIKLHEVAGFMPTIIGMRNPMNSWDKIDTVKLVNGETVSFPIGDNDLGLMTRLASAGPDHRKFARMMTVYVDITAPLYWWKEFDTYKVGTVANSCSTMHKISAKEFTLDDFSCEHLLDRADTPLGRYSPCSILDMTIATLNSYRELYVQTKDKKYWWQMIQLLPSSYNQKRTVMLNYEVLNNMYNSRKNHKLDEWQHFCNFIHDDIPYFREIMLNKKEKTNGLQTG